MDDRTPIFFDYHASQNKQMLRTKLVLVKVQKHQPIVFQRSRTTSEYLLERKKEKERK